MGHVDRDDNEQGLKDEGWMGVNNLQLLADKKMSTTEFVLLSMVR